MSLQRRVVLAAAAGYLIGSVPTGVLMGKLVAGVDVRKYGSRGSGATNVLRAVGPAAAAVTFTIDTAKGYLAVSLGDRLAGDEGGLVAAMGSGLGHSWPLFAGFQGGRSVLTCWGSLLAMDPRSAWISASSGVATTGATRYVSAGALSGVVSAAAATGLPGASGARRARLFSLFAVALLGYRLRSNMGRLARGEERRLGSEVNVAKDAAADLAAS